MWVDVTGGWGWTMMAIGIVNRDRSRLPKNGIYDNHSTDPANPASIREKGMQLS